MIFAVKSNISIWGNPIEISSSIDCVPIEKTDIDRNARLWSFKEGKS
jgi:hypothetical protein